MRKGNKEGRFLFANVVFKDQNGWYVWRGSNRIVERRSWRCFLFFLSLSLSLSARKQRKRQHRLSVLFRYFFRHPRICQPDTRPREIVSSTGTSPIRHVDWDSRRQRLETGALSSSAIFLSLSFFFFFIRSFYVYCMTGPLWPDYANGQTSNRYHARGKQKRDIPEKCKERKRKRKWNEMEKETRM